MSRFFAPKENVNGDLIRIDGREAKHILNVMRLTEGDKVVVFDGTGKEYTGFIKETKPKELTVEIVSVKTPQAKEGPAEITLAQSIPKKEKMDYIAEKATELGVHTIIPIVSKRTVVRPDKGASAAKVNRWRKIALEAAKQCGRSDVPEVQDIQDFTDIVGAVSDYDLALMACLSEETIDFKDAISDFETGRILVFIGPEGDFTPEEIALLKDTSCKFISLGKRVLKSDTAGLYALSILNHELSQ